MEIVPNNVSDIYKLVYRCKCTKEYIAYHPKKAIILNVDDIKLFFTPCKRCSNPSDDVFALLVSYELLEHPKWFQIYDANAVTIRAQLLKQEQ